VRVAISQPSYLPWSGFFDLIDQVDQFVLLDDAQFVKQSWHQRNRIKSPSGLLWLTVPVVFRGLLGQPISDVAIRDAQFWEKHARAVEVNYGRALYFERYYPHLKQILKDGSSGGNLSELNIALITWLAEELNISTRLVRCSTFHLEERRSPKLVSICKLLGASDYVSPRSADYLLQDNELFVDAGVKVWFQNYTHPIYDQRFPPFVPYASVLDLLFNQGPASGDIMRSGRRAALSPDQIRSVATECEAMS
jgi:WbqC-like protein family